MENFFSNHFAYLIHPLESRAGDLPEERGRFVQQDLRGVIFPKDSEKGRGPDGNRSMEGKEQGGQTWKAGHLPAGEDGLPAVISGKWNHPSKIATGRTGDPVPLRIFSGRAMKVNRLPTSLSRLQRFS